MRRAVSRSGLGFMSLIDRRIGVFFLSEAVGAFIAFGKGARANLFLLSGEIGELSGDSEKWDDFLAESYGVSVPECIILGEPKLFKASAFRGLTFSICFVGLIHSTFAAVIRDVICSSETNFFGFLSFLSNCDLRLFFFFDGEKYDSSYTGAS